MKKTLLLFAIFLCQFPVLSAQSLWLSDASTVYRLNLEACDLTVVTQIQNPVHINDLAFHPNGNLYGISSDGQLFEIDTLTGGINVIHIFNSPMQAFKALTSDANGIFYTSGSKKELFGYDLNKDEEIFFGVTEFAAAGDMSFYKGELYMSTKGPTAQINLSHPDSSFASHFFDVENDFTGLTTLPTDCFTNSIYGIESKLGQAAIHLLDFKNQTTEVICTVNTTLTGAASATEFLSSFAIKIKDIQIEPVTCGAQNGVINISIEGGFGNVFYELNSGQAQLQNEFSGLAKGIYQIKISDDWACEVETEIEVPRLICPVFIPNVFSPDNDGVNDVFRIESPGESDAIVLNFQIFNRWGALVFEKNNFPISDFDNWWDGTFRGKKVSSGVYLYVIEMEFETGDREIFQGDVMVIR